MRLIIVCLYLVSGFFMFALHARPLDAPTLVVQEYNESFLKSTDSNGKPLLPTQRVVHEYLTKHMKGVTSEKIAHLSKLVLRLSRRYQFPPGLILSIIRVESGFQPWAVSSQGALGLMQIMPETGAWLAARYGMRWDGPVTLLDEEANLTMGVRYLSYLRDKYGGELQKVLAAYNCGPAKVDENMAVGRNVAMDYYNKVKHFFPRLALAEPQRVAKTHVD
jgi:hypothetical protein